MWDLPRPGTKPVSLALQGRFLTTGPSGRPQQVTFCVSLLHYQRSPLETLKSYCYSPHSLFLAFMLGIGVIIKMTSHFALCLSLATEASCHMFISGSALLQSFSTEWFFSPSPGTCGNVCRHFWLSQLVSWGGVRLASSG